MPKLTPPLAAAPDCTMIVLAPMLAMVASRAAFEPCPISIMAITAPTPMITPRVVKAERSLLRRRAPKAVRSVGERAERRPGRGSLRSRSGEIVNSGAAVCGRSTGPVSDAATAVPATACNSLAAESRSDVPVAAGNNSAIPAGTAAGRE